VALRRLFESPTVSALAAAIEETRHDERAEGEQAIVAVSRAAYRVQKNEEDVAALVPEVTRKQINRRR
jgi:hypothetical protein